MFPSPLAVKYARAFLNVFGDSVPETIIDDIEHIIEKLDAARGVISSLKVFSYGESNNEMLKLFLRFFDIGKPLDKLIKLLNRDKRLYSTQEVLQAVKNLYQKDKGITDYVVTSACELTCEQKKILERFIYRHSGSRTRISWQIDRCLIAGIAIKADNALREDSVAKRLRTARVLATREYYGY